MAFTLYDTTELLAVIEPIRVPGQFLRALFFSATPILFDTPDVKWDRVFDDLRIAPFVSPYAPGKPSQDKGFQTESFTPGYLKPLDRVDPTKFSKRRPGEAIGGSLSLADRRDLMMLDYMAGQKKKLERRDEVMAAEILRTGRVTIVGEDYPLAIVDFARDPAMTKVLLGPARWTQMAGGQVAMLEGWLDDVATLVGAAPSHVVFDKKAWAPFVADPAFKTRIDLTTGQSTSAVNLGFQPGVPGSPVYKGRIGTVELYVYNDTYEDVDGTIKQLLPDYTVIIGAPGAFEGTPTYGAILDPEAGYIATPWFPKNWIDQNPAAEWVMTQSAPLPIPKRANATMCVTVG
ncbi:major capsid protein [Sphingomonas bacterium]|uniref:major capsid protein n=1 Tax=Sphingomonas bacterium TaxID=1895847 RepID=UPI001574F2DF|nr:major capsid protein [Sphingomonas bacterium]